MSAFEVSFGAEPYEEQQSPSPPASPHDPNPFDALYSPQPRTSTGPTRSNSYLARHPSASVTRYRSRSIGQSSGKTQPLVIGGVSGLGGNGQVSTGSGSTDSRGNRRSIGHGQGQGQVTSVREEDHPTSGTGDQPYDSGLGETISGYQPGDDVYRTTSPSSPIPRTRSKLKPTGPTRRTSSSNAGGYEAPPLFPLASPTSLSRGTGQYQSQGSTTQGNDLHASPSSPPLQSLHTSDPSNPPPAWTRRTTVKRTPGGHTSNPSLELDQPLELSPLIPPPTLPITASSSSSSQRSSLAPSISSIVPARRRSGVDNAGGVRSRTGSAGSAASTISSPGQSSRSRTSSGGHGYRRPVGLAGLQMTSSSESRGTATTETGSDLFDAAGPNPAFARSESGLVNGGGVYTPASSTTSLRSPSASASKEYLAPPPGSRYSGTVRPGTASPASSGDSGSTNAYNNPRVEYITVPYARQDSEPGEGQGEITPTKSGRADEVPDLSNPFRQSYERPLDTVRRLSRHVDDGMAVSFGGTNDVIWPEGPPVPTTAKTAETLPQSRPPRARSSISLSSKAGGPGTKSARSSYHASQSTPVSPMVATKRNSMHGLKESKFSSASLAAMSASPIGGAPLEDFTRELYSSLLPREGGYALAANIGGHGSGNLPKRESVIERGRGNGVEGPDVMTNSRRQSNVFRQSNDWSHADMSGYMSTNASGPSLPLQISSTNTSSSSLPSLVQQGNPGYLAINTSPAALGKIPSPLSQNMSVNESGRMPEEDAGLQMRRKTGGGQAGSSPLASPAVETTIPPAEPPAKQTKKEMEDERKARRFEAERAARKRAEDEKERKRLAVQAEKDKKKTNKLEKEQAKVRKKEDEKRAKEQQKASRRSSTLVKARAPTLPPLLVTSSVAISGKASTPGSGSPVDMPATPLKGKTIPIAATPASMPTTPDSAAALSPRGSVGDFRQDNIGDLLRPALANASTADPSAPTASQGPAVLTKGPPGLPKPKRPETPQRKSSIWGSLRKKFSSGPAPSVPTVGSPQTQRMIDPEVLAPVAPVSVLPDGYGAPPSRPTSIHQGMTRTPSIHDQGLLLSTSRSSMSHDVGYSADALRADYPTPSDHSGVSPGWTVDKVEMSPSALVPRPVLSARPSLDRSTSANSISSSGQKRHSIAVSRFPINNHKTVAGPRSRPHSTMVMGSYEDVARPPSSWTGSPIDTSGPGAAYDLALPISRETSRASSGGGGRAIQA